MPFTQNLAYFSFCTLTLPMQYVFFLSSFCTALLISVQVVSHIAACQPFFFFFFAFPVVSNFILSHHIIGAEALRCRPFLWNLKKKQW